MTDAVLVFDEGGVAGMGHRARMDSLAKALDAVGVRSRLRPAGDRCDADVVVVDSYRTRADDRDSYRAEFLVAVEDLGRDLSVDLLVDPNPPDERLVYRAATHVLQGPRYALLSVADAARRDLAGEPLEILVATGASDIDGIGARIASELIARVPLTRVRLVLGPSGSQDLPAGVEAVRSSTGLVPDLTTADVVVTAAGVTMLEALALGKPVVAFTLAENQDRSARGVAAAKAGIIVDVSAAATAAAGLLADGDARQRLSELARTYVDGNGSHRVARAITELAGARSPS